MTWLTHVLLALQIPFPISNSVWPTLPFWSGEMLKFTQKINPTIVSMKQWFCVLMIIVVQIIVFNVNVSGWFATYLTLFYVGDPYFKQATPTNASSTRRSSKIVERKHAYHHYPIDAWWVATRVCIESCQDFGPIDLLGSYLLREATVV